MDHPTAKRTFVIGRGALYAAGFLILWSWIALSVGRFDDRLPLVLVDWVVPVGWVLATFGAGLAGLCVATFVTKGQGTPAPFDPPRKFVATGPYRYVRNPMYIGAFLMLLGIGFLLQSPSMAVLSMAFLLLAHLFVVLYEEPGLLRRFGESYERYRASVNRWIPRRPSQSRVFEEIVRTSDDDFGSSGL